jgi:hypothetical protein
MQLWVGKNFRTNCTVCVGEFFRASNVLFWLFFWDKIAGLEFLVFCLWARKDHSRWLRLYKKIIAKWAEQFHVFSNEIRLVSSVVRILSLCTMRILLKGKCEVILPFLYFRKVKFCHLKTTKTNLITLFLQNLSDFYTVDSWNNGIEGGRENFQLFRE